MTRINTICPQELTRLHLMAEARELPRVFSYVAKLEAKGLTPCKVGIPANYVLGAGHVKFFADKLAYLEKRYFSLVDELIRRGINIKAKDYIPCSAMPSNKVWFKDWTPDDDAIRLNRERIMLRISEKPWLYEEV